MRLIETAVGSIKRVVEAVSESRKKRRHLVDETPDCNDRTLCEMARYTDSLALKPYERFLQYVPRIVNVKWMRVTRGPAVGLPPPPAGREAH